MNKVILFAALVLATFGAGYLISSSKFPWQFSKQKNQHPTAVAAAPALPVLGNDEEADVLLKKAIAAHGGAEKLARFQTFRTRYEGIIYIQDIRCQVKGDDADQRPDKVRSVHRFMDDYGNMVDVISGFDGAKVWGSARNRYHENADEKLAAAIRKHMLLEVYAMGEFLEPSYQLTNIGTQDIFGEETIVLAVNKEGEPEARFYINKKTHLIAKTQSTAYNVDWKRRVRVERYNRSFFEVEGVQFPKHIQIYNDGQMRGDVEITSLTLLDRLDESIFSRP